MSTTYKIIKYLIDIGPVIIIPCLFLIIGFFSTRNVLINLKNSLFILLGFISLSILMTIFVNFFEPLTNTIIINSLKEYEIIDTGWLVTEAVAFNSEILLYIIIAIFILNMLMLFLRFTRTINIDLWGYWSFLLVGSIIFTITEIVWISILISVIVAAITFVLSDIYAHHIESYYGLRGISNPRANIICWAPFSHLINIILNKIPLIKRVHLFYEEIQYKLGVFSEPLVMGFILGFIIGIITHYRTLYLELIPNLLYALSSGIRLAVIMVLLPRAVNLLMKGMVPAVNNFRSLIRRRITRRTIYIGLDSIILVGHPSVIGLSVIIIPLTVYLSTLLPGNRVLPSADLVIIPFLIVWAIILSKGDFFRSFISSAVIIPLVLWITTDMGELFTNFFVKYDLDLVGNYASISSMGASSNIFFWMLLQIIKPILNLFV
ncbi:MAG: PTS transporter subunit IIC [Candidatus Humimicrobiaceae bacterium]